MFEKIVLSLLSGCHFLLLLLFFYNNRRQTVEDEETLHQSFSEAESGGAQAASEQTAIYGR